MKAKWGLSMTLQGKHQMGRLESKPKNSQVIGRKAGSLGSAIS